MLTISFYKCVGVFVVLFGLFLFSQSLFSGEIMSIDVSKLAKYQAEVYMDYGKDIGLPTNYSFLNGIPVKPLPPMRATIGGVMIIGAYPSAVFESKSGRVVPVGNLREPFDPTTHGGAKNKSAEELDQNILTPLGISRDNCWVTNMVKVFLFKPEHASQFAALKSTVKGYSTRDDFEAYAQKSLPWLKREIEMAQPKIIVTLGAEVAGVLRGVKQNAKRNALLNYRISNLKLGPKEYRIVHFVHPGMLMRKNPKWLKIHNQGIGDLKQEILKVLEE